MWWGECRTDGPRRPCDEVGSEEDKLALLQSRRHQSELEVRGTVLDHIIIPPEYITVVPSVVKKIG